MNLTVSPERDRADARWGFDSFFRTSFPGVARAAALVTGDTETGLDLAQEAFSRLLPRWTAMESDDHARNFTYRVAINLARSHLRKTASARRNLTTRSEPVTPDPTDASDDWLVIAAGLAALTPRQRACVVLVDYVDMDSTSAARTLGMTASTVRVHLMRGRRALRLGLGITTEEGER